ncbi:hypothetical protein EUTSA_v10029183mg, partial [Eutrema salsugineum]
LLYALAILGKMMRLEYDPSIVTLNLLLNGFCHENRVSDAVSLVDQMNGTITYSTLINGLCMQDLLEEANEMFELMTSKGCLPNYQRGFVGKTFTYTTLIQGFFQIGDCDNVLEFFKQMLSSGVPHDIITYEILLDGLCDNGKLEKALVIFQYMQKEWDGS